MTPAEMREVPEHVFAQADEADDAAEDVTALAAAIRALPLPEEAPLTPREKLRRVREAREVLATARIAYVPRGAGYVTDEATGRRLGDWRSRCETYAQPTTTRRRWGESTGLVEVRRTWVLDTLRAEGWDVVEEGEGDG